MNWFELLEHPLDPKLRGRANATRDELRELGTACRELGVSERTRLLLATLASYPPSLRLSLNLKTVSGLLLRSRGSDVLRDGLLPEEYAALAELDKRGMPRKLLEVAHGLLNVHERWHAMRSLGRFFRVARKVDDEYLEPKGS